MISLKNKLFISASALFLVMGTVSHQANASHTSFTQDDVYKAYSHNPASPQKGSKGRGKLGLALDGVSGTGLKKMFSMIEEEGKPLMTFKGRSDQPFTISDFESFKKAITTISECFAKRLVNAIYDYYTDGGEAEAAFQELKKTTFIPNLEDISDNEYADAFSNFMYVKIDGESYSAVNLTTSRAIAKGLFDENNRDLEATYASIHEYLKLATTTFLDNLDGAQSSTLQARLEKVEEKRRALLGFKVRAEESVETLLEERARLQKALEEQDYESRQQKAYILDLESAVEGLNTELSRSKMKGQSDLQKAVRSTLNLIEYALGIEGISLDRRDFLTRLQVTTKKKLEEISSKSEQSSSEIAQWYSEETERIIGELNETLRIAKKSISTKEENILELRDRLASTEDALEKVRRESTARIHDLTQEQALTEQARLKLVADLQLESHKLGETQSKLAQTEQRLSKKESQLKDAREQVEELTQKTVTLTETTDRLSERLGLSEAAKKQLETRIQRLEDDIRLVGGNNTDLTEELRQTKIQLSQATQEVLADAQKLLKQDGKIKKAQEKLKRAEKTVVDLQEEKDELEVKVRKHEALIQKHEKTIDGLEDDKRQMQAAIDRIVDENKDLAKEIRRLEQENAHLKGNTTSTVQAQQKIARVKGKRDQALREKGVVEGELRQEKQVSAQLLREKGIVEGDRDQALLDKGVVEGELRQEKQVSAQLQREKAAVEGDLILERRALAQVQLEKGVAEDERDEALREKALVEVDLRQEKQVSAQLLLQVQQLQAQVHILQAQVPVAPVFTIQELQENAMWQAVYDHLNVETQTKMLDGSYVMKDKAGKLIRWVTASSNPESFEGSFISQKKKAPTIVYR